MSYPFSAINNIDINEDINIESLDYHGITAGFINKLKLVERIDARLPTSKKHGAILSHGQRVKAMIICGLGFTQSPIYLSHHFFENKALAVLFGKGVKHEHFNDDALGRTLDAIYAYGVTELFAEIANEIAQEFMPATKRQRLHLDTTSLKLSGDYDVNADGEEDKNQPPRPMHGHSKDHRPDLKSLTVTGPANLPLWIEGLNGNSQDKTNFHQTLARIEQFRAALEKSPDILVIADSALYVQDKLSNTFYTWLTRVPESVKVAKQLVISEEEIFAWQTLGNGYKGVWLGQEDRGMRQHWGLIYSEQANKRETITLNRRIEKAQLTAEKEARKLKNEPFTCEKDAQRAAIAFEKKLKYHQVNYQLVPIKKFTGRGRPKAGEQRSIVHYELHMTLRSCEEKQRPSRNKLGRFILSTNDLNNQDMDLATLLVSYKEQQGVERGFRFIKDPQFHLNSIFLKKPERINALMMIMTLCLMVYNTGEYEIRETLKKENETVLNQVGKATSKPTMRWLFQRMNGINVLFFQGKGACITGLSEEKRRFYACLDLT
ncbi:IS1634 family transposase [Colwellia sp. C1TZA3]|uniref:IS1634 family transposase n=1 Tax=Colwellia sp. C1TZA3 TaxID=2508879 RepID=UPI0011B9C687|nr:IS1634 family transposase [Colwellia sp. C1TZA3]TWX70391.1 IS1634 family transposase [Colwellia sp. C1TZA3]